MELWTSDTKMYAYRFTDLSDADTVMAGKTVAVCITVLCFKMVSLCSYHVGVAELVYCIRTCLALYGIDLY